MPIPIPVWAGVARSGVRRRVRGSFTWPTAREDCGWLDLHLGYMFYERGKDGKGVRGQGSGHNPRWRIMGYKMPIILSLSNRSLLGQKQRLLVGGAGQGRAGVNHVSVDLWPGSGFNKGLPCSLPSHMSP